MKIMIITDIQLTNLALIVNMNPYNKFFKSVYNFAQANNALSQKQDDAITKSYPLWKSESAIFNESIRAKVEDYYCQLYSVKLSELNTLVKDIDFQTENLPLIESWLRFLELYQKETSIAGQYWIFFNLHDLILVEKFYSTQIRHSKMDYSEKMRQFVYKIQDLHRICTIPVKKVDLTYLIKSV